MNKNWQYLLPGSTVEEVKYGGGVAAKVRYRGFTMLVEPGYGLADRPKGTIHVVLSAVLTEEAQQAAVHGVLRQLLTNQKRLTAGRVEGNSIQLTFKGTLNKKTLQQVLNPVLIPLVNTLEQNRVSSGCQLCGSSFIDSYALEGRGMCLCSGCSQRMKLDLEDRQQKQRSKRGSALAGTVGALLGGLIGAAVWFVIYQMGYISALGGLAIAVLACKGYELLGKHLDKVGVVICVLVTLAMTYFANQLCWSFEIYQALAGEGFTFLDSNLYMMEVLELSELTGTYFGELALGILFSALGAFGTLRQAYSNADGQYQFVKL